MSREIIHRCDRCRVAYNPQLNALRAGNRNEVFDPGLDGYMDLCGSCEDELHAWLRAPLEDETGAIDPTTGQPA
jgi:hypothetical protein